MRTYRAMCVCVCVFKISLNMGRYLYFDTLFKEYLTQENLSSADSVFFFCVSIHTFLSNISFSQNTEQIEYRKKKYKMKASAMWKIDRTSAIHILIRIKRGYLVFTATWNNLSNFFPYRRRLSTNMIFFIKLYKS